MILRSLIESRTNPENPSIPLTSNLLLSLLGGQPTAAGKIVNPDNALTVSAVYASVRLIAGLGLLPIDVYDKAGKDRNEVIDDPQVRVITDQPNSEMDAGELWSRNAASMATRGNGFVYPQFDNGGRLVGLWPIPRERVRAVRLPRNAPTPGGLMYIVKLNDSDFAPNFDPETDRALFPHELMHFRCPLGGNGIMALSPIEMAKQEIGGAMANQEYVNRFYANDATPGGVIEVPTELTDIQFQRLNAQWTSLHQGLERSHLMGILESGGKFNPTTVSPQDAQTLETRKYSVSDIARFFGVPPHMIGDVDRSTSWGTGIEQMSIGFVVYSLANWIRRHELEIRRVLWSRTMPQRYVKFNVNGLLRGDITARYAAYATGRQWGWLTVNNILRNEDMDPIGVEGDTYLEPSNMVPAGTLGADQSQSQQRLIEAIASAMRSNPDRPITVNTPDVRVNIEPSPVSVNVEAPAPDVTVTVPEQPAPEVRITPQITVQAPKQASRRSVKRDEDGRIQQIVDEED